MIRFLKRLYIGESVRNVSLIKWKLKHFAGMLRVYLIAVCPGQDQLEFYHCSMLKQKIFRKHPIYVVGIANGKEEALAVVETIVGDVYQITGACRLKEYFMKEFENRRLD